MGKRVVHGIGVFLLLLAMPAFAGEVSQGKCLAYDKAKKECVIEAYDLQITKESPYGRPTGDRLTFSTGEAAIGIEPAIGDILRIAYEVRADKKFALKIMNVSKQDLRKK